MQLDEQTQELDPSTSSAQDDQQQTAVQQDDAPAATAAESSPATGENDDSLLNVVRDAVAESRGEKEASPADGANDGQQADDAKTKPVDNEGFSDVPFHKHPRFRELLQQRNAFKTDAESFQQVRSFISDQGLNNEEVADGLIIMGLMKSNPVEAWKRLKPTVQQLLVAAGEILPPELDQMVQNGTMTHEAAIEVSRARAGVQASQTQMTFQQQRQQRQQQEQAANSLVSSANEWEAQRRQRDPNFDGKATAIHKEVLYLQSTEGRPTTPQGVREQLDKAYKAVNESFRPAAPTAQRPATPAPRKPQVKPITGGQVAGKTQPAAMSTLDIVRANRRAQT